MIYFSADTHFRHENLWFKHMPARRAAFPTLLAMDSHLVAECNRVVKPNDELWHLGDVVWGISWFAHYRDLLKVRYFHVILGNHDKPGIAKYVSSCQDSAYVKLNDLRFHLYHYPLVSWRGREKIQSVHLYGHCHATMETYLDQCFPGRRAMDVGVDNAFRLLGQWRPFSFDEILSFLKIPDVI